MRNLKGILFVSLLLFGVASMFVTLPTPSASGEVPWKDQSRQWYYDNLDDIDRQKIRQAFDYCVPREEIIEGLHLGFATAIASPIGVNFVGIYEASIAAREYNTTTAAGLLEDVFGYSYDSSLTETNETSKVTAEPYFKMTLVAPTTNTVRCQWVALISYSLNRVGVGTIIKWWNWGTIMPRLFLDPIGTGYDYQHGGYDMFFVGRDASPDPIYKEYYDKNCFPPSSNCYWIEDGPATSGKYATTGLGTNGAYPNITALWTDIYKEMDYATRVDMLKEYQQWCYDNVPTVIIRQEMQLWALNAALEGFDTFHGIQEMIGNWTGIGTSAVIAQPGDYVDFNPQLSSSYYDEQIFTNTHVSLSHRRGDYNLTHAYPWLAENWTHSPDYKTWTVNIRQGNKWSDGEPITADDVVFTYHAILNTSLAAPCRGTLYNILGDATGTDGKYSCVTKGVNDYQVIFTLPEVYVYVETVLFSVDILPEHQMSVIPLASWKNHGTNTGDIPIVAAGQYVLGIYTKPNDVEIWTNPYYNDLKMGHDPTAVGGGNWLPNATTAGHVTNCTFKVVKSNTTAVTGIIAGTYDVLDSQMGIQADFDKVNDSTNAKILTSYEWGYQEMSINHYNPIFGMNAQNPRIVYGDPRNRPADYDRRFQLFIFFSLLPFIVSIPILGILLLQKLSSAKN